jgi:hypothetical protein
MRQVQIGRARRLNRKRSAQRPDLGSKDQTIKSSGVVGEGKGDLRQTAKIARLPQDAPSARAERQKEAKLKHRETQRIAEIVREEVRRTHREVQLHHEGEDAH